MPAADQRLLQRRSKRRRKRPVEAPVHADGQDRGGAGGATSDVSACLQNSDSLGHACDGTQGVARSLCCLDSDDFLSLAFGAGLRSNDASWMDDFNRVGDLGDDKVGSEVFVSLVMDDLVRHCQQTRDSLQDMLKLTTAPSTPSDVSTEAIVAPEKAFARRNELGDIMPLQLHLKEKLDTHETLQKTDDNKEDKREELAATQDSPRLRVWKKTAMDECSKVTETSRKAEKLLLKPQKHPRKEPFRFDPIPEVCADASAKKTDWQAALQDIFDAS